MPFHEKESIRYYTFDLLDRAGIKHAVFTRRGGISPVPWDSLNVGGLTGDDPERVYQNRVLSFEALGRDPESVYDCWLVHGTEVIFTEAPRPKEQAHRKADIIFTDRQEISLFMRFADCVPIVLVDPVRGVAGLVHAGWQGTVKGVVQTALQAMQAQYGVLAKNVLAAIGPSICVDHYPVGEDVAEAVRLAFGQQSEPLLPIIGGQIHFDLWAANRMALEACGVEQIEVAGLCTACHLEDWYSHRAERGKTGRFGLLLTLGD